MDQLLESLLDGIGGYRAYGGNTSHYARNATSQTSTQSSDTSSELDFIEGRLDRLTLVCMAMWSLIQDKTNLTEEDLLERVRVIDMMDGTTDNKAKRSMQKCANCDRPMSMRHQRCLYCGHEKLVQSAFDRV